jgi:hypothetical protein
MPWFTTKDGKHINTDWFDKERQIEFNKNEASTKNLEEKYKYVNSKFKKDSDIYDKEGFNNNCVKCALAFEANMRGNDTEANPFKFGDSNDIDKSKNINKAFGVDREDVWDVGRAKKELAVREIELMMTEDFGNGSRAIIQIESAGVRHTMNIINQNGKIIVIDAQNGTQGSVKDKLKGLPTNHIQLIRTDDKIINKDYAEWAYKRRN